MRHTTSQSVMDPSPIPAKEPCSVGREGGPVSRILALLELRGPMELRDIVGVTGIKVDVAATTLGRLRKTGRVAIDDPWADLATDVDTRSKPRQPSRRFRFVQHQIAGREHEEPCTARSVQRPEGAESRGERISLALSTIEMIMTPTLQATVACLRSVSSKRVCALLTRGDDPEDRQPRTRKSARPNQSGASPA